MSRRIRVLVVDEEPLIGEVIRAAVEDAGHGVTAVQSEREAIAALAEPFDLLLLHRQLPDTTSNELVRRARQHTHPAVVLLSSQRSLEAEQNMLRLGAAEILYKPLDPYEIRACVERHRDAGQPKAEVPGGPRVLVVDDDQAVLLSVQDILEEHYQVAATPSPYEALRLLRASPFEILLADLMMDELSGIDLIRAARNTRPALQAIVMTGYASKSTAVAALKEGAYDFLEKPLTPDVVRRTVARAWKSLRYELENRRLLGELRAQLVERERLIAELEARNAELERVSYTVSHELKGPLVTIKGFLGLLREDAAAGDGERLEEDVERIAGAANQLRRLLDELLEFLRIGRIIKTPEEVPFGGLARAAVAALSEELAERGVAVEIAPDLPVVFADRARLVEVLQILISNAVRFMGDQIAPRVEVGARRQGPEAAPSEPIFFVRDNGIGIKREYHEKVFGLFERLDAATEGTGVGLALVKRIVEVHGGRVWVESEGADRGSTFCFTLPRGPADPHPIAGAELP
ncbi:MAG: response regulator [bacterium]|nr:response regulator [bacterium]